LKKIIIVLAEDDHQIASLVKFKLEKDGYTVHLGENGRVALDLINKTVPDMVILDVMMPVMDGFDVLRTLKSSDDTSSIPVIMLTLARWRRTCSRGSTSARWTT